MFTKKMSFPSKIRHCVKKIFKKLKLPTSGGKCIFAIIFYIKNNSI
jgi:hypothetical protein